MRKRGFLFCTIIIKFLHLRHELRGEYNPNSKKYKKLITMYAVIMNE